MLIVNACISAEDRARFIVNACISAEDEAGEEDGGGRRVRLGFGGGGREAHWSQAALTEEGGGGVIW